MSAVSAFANGDSRVNVFNEEKDVKINSESKDKCTKITIKITKTTTALNKSTSSASALSPFYNPTYEIAFAELRKRVIKEQLESNSIKDFQKTYPIYPVTEQNRCDLIAVQWARHYLVHGQYHSDYYLCLGAVGWVMQRLVPKLISKVFWSRPNLFLQASVADQIQIVNNANSFLYELEQWNQVQDELINEKFDKINFVSLSAIQDFLFSKDKITKDNIKKLNLIVF